VANISATVFASGLSDLRVILIPGLLLSPDAAPVVGAGPPAFGPGGAGCCELALMTIEAGADIDGGLGGSRAGGGIGLADADDDSPDDDFVGGFGGCEVF
jgi:hypothetical protein